MMQLLAGMIEDPMLVHQIIEFESTKASVVNRVLLDAGCDAILPGDDYCSKDGPLMSPRHFDTFIQPHLAMLCDTVHHEGKYVIKHTDGNTWKILDRLLDAGIDGWHGIQANAGMDLSKLVICYGERLCFWGGIDVDYLVSGSPEDVRRVVKDSILHASRHYGLVLTSGNTLMVGVNFDNYKAMLDAHREFGTYPIPKYGEDFSYSSH
jgi:uroporphyrinogen decarboxylase